MTQVAGYDGYNKVVIYLTKWLRAKSVMVRNGCWLTDDDGLLMIDGLNDGYIIDG